MRNVKKKKRKKGGGKRKEGRKELWKPQLDSNFESVTTTSLAFHFQKLFPLGYRSTALLVLFGFVCVVYA